MAYQQHHTVLDLKVRVPQQLVQRLQSAAAACSDANTNPDPPAGPPPPPPRGRPDPGDGAGVPQPVGGVAACACGVGLLAAADWGPLSAQHAACVQLGVGPLSGFLLLSFALHHPRGRWFTAAMGLGAVLLANAGCVCACARVGPAWAGRALLSSGVSVGGLQLLLLVSRANVAVVMMCTACTVVLAVLALAAAYTEPPTSQRWLRSAGLPVLWLFWHASVGYRPGGRCADAAEEASCV